MAQKIITIENLHEVTAQEVFDYVTSKVVEQGKPSIDLDRDSCMYRNGDLCCAAGHLLPDSVDTKLWDLKSLTWTILVEKELVPSNHVELIVELQSAHDNSAWRCNSDHGRFVELVKNRFANVAEKFNLECDYES